MGMQEIGLIAAGVIVLGTLAWIANKISQKTSASSKQ